MKGILPHSSAGNSHQGLLLPQDLPWHLPVNRGLINFDEIKYEYYRNSEALWSAVKTGEVSVFYDSDVARWAEGYDFPSAVEGRLKRDEVSHGRPTGMHGFVFNTRRDLFADRRVREALALSFDWEWVNARMYEGQYARITSYFGNSPLGYSGAAALPCSIGLAGLMLARDYPTETTKKPATLTEKTPHYLLVSSSDPEGGYGVVLLGQPPVSKPT